MAPMSTTGVLNAITLASRLTVKITLWNFRTLAREKEEKLQKKRKDFEAGHQIYNEYVTRVSLLRDKSVDIFKNQEIFFTFSPFRKPLNLRRKRHEKRRKNVKELKMKKRRKWQLTRQREWRPHLKPPHSHPMSR